MQNSNRSTPQTENSSTCAAQDAGERLLHQRLHNNMEPFGLEVDCPSLLAWAEEWQQTEFRQHLLVRELRAWGDFLAKKPLTFTFFIEPFSMLDAPGLTELVYAVGRNLQLLHSYQVEHGATLRLCDLTHQNLALLRGLEFNHLCVKIGEDFTLDELRPFKQIVRDYKFKHCSLELDFDARSEPFLMLLADLLTHIQPCSLRFSVKGVAPLRKVNHDRLAAVLMQVGYFLNEAGWLIKFKSVLTQPPLDILRLGPGSQSQFDNVRITNLVEPTEYSAKIEKNLRPIAAYS